MTKDMVEMFERWSMDHCNSMSEMKERLEKLEEAHKFGPDRWKHLHGDENGANILERLEKAEKCLQAVEKHLRVPTWVSVDYLDEQRRKHEERLERLEESLRQLGDIEQVRAKPGQFFYVKDEKDEKKIRDLQSRVGELATQNVRQHMRLEKLEVNHAKHTHRYGDSKTRPVIETEGHAPYWCRSMADECTCDARKVMEEHGLVVVYTGCVKQAVCRIGHPGKPEMMANGVCIHCGKPIKRSLL
jgi:hypothetical protein